MADDNFVSNLFGDPELRASERADRSDKSRTLAQGDGKHFLVVVIGDQCIECELICEWPADDDKAPCYDPALGDGCKIKYSWENAGQDMLEKNPDPKELLEVKLPVGYRTEGYGEDYEDFLYSVRPHPQEGKTE